MIDAATESSVAPLRQISEHIRSEKYSYADSMDGEEAPLDAEVDTACSTERDVGSCSTDHDSTLGRKDANFNSLQLRRDLYSALTTFAAGGIAGAASRTLTAPLDRIKIIMQEGHLMSKTSLHDRHSITYWLRHSRLADAARLIKHDGGWAAFWRGNLINCFKAGPEFAIVFTLRRYMFSIYEEAIENERAYLRDTAVARQSLLQCTQSSASSSSTEHLPVRLDDKQCDTFPQRSSDCATKPAEKERHASKSSIAAHANVRDHTLPTSKSGRQHDGNSDGPCSCYGSRGCDSTRLTDADKTSFLRVQPASLSSGEHNAEMTAQCGPEQDSFCTDEGFGDRTYKLQNGICPDARTVPSGADCYGTFSYRCLKYVPLLFVNCSIGAVAGLVAQSILYPMELVKTRVVVSRRNEYVGGVRDIIRDAYRRGGLREFYRGFTPNMIGIVVYRGLEMGLYSNAQQSIMLYRMQYKNKTRHEAALSSAEIAIASAFASIVAQTISYPLNVVRTHLQTQGSNGRIKKYTGMMDCFVKIVQHKGSSSLFSGLTANYLKAVPASACTFIVFEKMQALLIGDD